MAVTTIREPQPRDAEDLAALLSNDERLRRDLGMKADDRPTAESVLRTLEEWCGEHRATTFVIVMGGAAVGTISLSHRSEDGRTARIGY